MDELRVPNVAILGFSAARSLAPLEDPDWEIWVCNRLPIILEKEGKPNWDRHFDIHTFDESTRQQTGHNEHDWQELLDFIKRDHGERHGMRRLSYVSEVPDGAPSAVQYPFEEVLANIGRRYIASGIGWMIAYAIYLQARKISTFGIDLKHDTEYVFQRPNAEWLLGLAEGRGIEVITPETSALLNSDGTCLLYGFPGDLRGPIAEVEHFVMARQAELDKKIEELKKVNEDSFNQLNVLGGQKGEAEYLLYRLRMKRRGGAL